MVLSPKERSALWRQRQRENPTLHEKYKQKERERNKQRREGGDGNRKSVKEMTEREKRKKRKEWRVNQRKKRVRDKDILSSLPETPPISPENREVNRHTPNAISNRTETIRRTGRKKKRKDRAKAYRNIEKLQVALFKKQRLVDKWKKRCQRMKDKGKSNLDKKINNIIERGETKKALMLYQMITDRVKRRYQTSKSNDEKRLISRLVCAYKTIRRYRIGLYTKKYLGISVRPTKNQTKNKFARKTPRSKHLVFEFLNRDDNSRIKAGKKSTITKKGEKRQIRLLNDDLKTLHAKFLAETPCKISYSLFCQFKPFNIVKPSAKDRETCLCKTCQNIALKLDKCHQEKALTSKDVEGVLRRITCNTESKECMYRECSVCKGKEIEFDQSTDMGKQISWFNWKTKRIEKEKSVNGEIVKTGVNITAKEKEYGSLMVLREEINKDIQRVAKHAFNIKHQYKSLRYLRESLAPEELIVHIDFSENYNCKYANEIQSMHFGSSQKQISLHTGVAYTRETIISFCSVSDCLKHSPAGIWAHLHPILKELRQKTNTTIIHFISDGPTTQYRNKQNFFLLTNKVFQYGFKSATWNFLEAGHGKGAADGIGAVIKRSADAYVNKGGDITVAADLMKAIMSTGTTVKLAIITEKDVNEIEEEFPLSLKPVPRTMQIHQITVTSPGTMSYRPLSCFCSRPNSCPCFRPESASFLVQSSPNPELAEGVSVADVDGTEFVADSPKLERILEVNENLISRYCVVKYDGKAYPGIILSVDEEEELEVKTMHRIGKNRFFWPMMDDSLWYAKENIITLLRNPPRQVTKRHQEINPDIWQLVEKEEDDV